MAEFTRLTGAQRPLRQIATPSGAEGQEAISSVFGKLASKSAEIAVEINKEKSNASLYNATNQIYRLKHMIHEDFLRNPDQVTPLMDSAISDVKNIVAQTPMNDADRKRLDYLANNDITDIEVQGTRIKAEHAKAQGAIMFATQWPEKLQQINESWSDEKTLNYQMENAKKIVDDAMMSGYITPHQRENYIATLHDTVERAKAIHEVFENQEKHTAKEYHNAKQPYHQPNTFDQVGAPSNETTNFLYRHEVDQKNMEDARAALYNDRPINPMLLATDTLTLNNLKEIKAIQSAISDVKSIFSSGGGWDELEKIHKSLDSKKDTLLSTEERAAKTYLDNFFNEFTPDKFLKIVSTTPIGAQATYEHNMQINAVETNKSYSPEVKEQILRDADNQYADKMVAAGIAKQIPTNLIMPIASPVIAKAQGAFSAGGNPMDLIATVDHYNRRNRVYVAQAMKDPVQKEIAYTVGVLEGKTNNVTRQLLVASNQPGIDWKPLQIPKEEGGISESIVRKDVESDPNISKIIEYNSRFPVKPGEDRGPSMVNMTTNAVRYQSLRKGDYQLKDYQKNISDLGKEYSKAYSIHTGSDFAFNRVQQPQVSDYEWASIAEYAKEEAYKNMRSLAPGASNVDFRQTQDINPLYVTITPDNYIIAQDQSGSVAYSTPFSQSFLAHAVMKIKELEKTKRAERETSAAKKEIAYRGIYK